MDTAELSISYSSTKAKFKKNRPELGYIMCRLTCNRTQKNKDQRGHRTGAFYALKRGQWRILSNWQQIQIKGRNLSTGQVLKPIRCISRVVRRQSATSLLSPYKCYASLQTARNSCLAMIQSTNDLITESSFSLTRNKDRPPVVGNEREILRTLWTAGD